MRLEGCACAEAERTHRPPRLDGRIGCARRREAERTHEPLRVRVGVASGNGSNLRRVWNVSICGLCPRDRGDAKVDGTDAGPEAVAMRARAEG
jgi:hypothetical protein